jgi:hypothetical protein
MGCLRPEQRAAIEAQIVKIDALIAAGEDALLEAITNSEIETYRFDSGDGSQRTDRRDPRQINDLIDDLTARRNRLQRKLDGTMNVTMTFRRRDYCNGYRR